MANPEHLKILKQGVKVWNEWRRENRQAIPDLSKGDLVDTCLAEADLAEADVSEAYLRRANLIKASLKETNLQRADLVGALLWLADLSEANLDQASLHGASLQGANLTRTRLANADLSGANLLQANLFQADVSSASLVGADLRLANLFQADLTGADLTSASVGLTVLDDIDLSVTQGLETVHHTAPSTVGIDTIYRSKGNIPEVFLRGCGVPEDFIVYMRSLVGKPIEFYSCFISYSSKDDDFAQRLYADLQAQNVRCWFAPEDLKIGDKFRMRIDEAIRIHDKLLLVLSENSVKSAWVEKEVETAFEKERRQDNKPVLFPIRLDDAVMQTDQAWAADIRRTRHIGDFVRWKEHDAYQQAFRRLLRDLNAEAGPPLTRG
jgi:hypothetical protein